MIVFPLAPKDGRICFLCCLFSNSAFIDVVYILEALISFIICLISHTG